MALTLVQQQIEIGIDQEAVDLWVLYRSKHTRKPVNEMAMTMILNKMRRWPEEDHMRLVQLGIECGWTSLNWRDRPKEPNGISTRDSDIRDDLTDTSWAN